MENVTHDQPSRKYLADANSVLLSAICHLVGFVVLALLTVATQEKGHLSLWLNTAGDGVDSLSDDLGGGTFELGEAAPNSEAFESMAIASNSLGPPDPNASLFGEALAPGAVGGSPGQGTGLGEGIGAEFFGIGGRGSTFIYVIDCSGSMLDRKKFDRAKKELMRSIRSLKSEQKFYIILYSDGAYPMDADEPLPAISENIDRIEAWLNSVRPDGMTNPLSALKYALSLKPSAVYFLSDGKFDLSVAQELRVANRSRRKRVPIHTIAFYNREAEGLMKMIARNSGGRYEFIKW